MSYDVYFSNYFKERYKTFFDKNEILKFDKFIKKIKAYPYYGKPLRVSFVREFKSKKGKRAYFIIYDKYKLIYFVELSSKKQQKDVIKKIFANLIEYEAIIKKYYTL